MEFLDRLLTQSTPVESYWRNVQYYETVDGELVEVVVNKQARGINSTQNSTTDQGGVQQPQVQVVRQSQPPARMQYQENEALDSESGGKEIRTYRRDGINIIEEYERLNPDGTVTKTISIGDKKNGLKKFEVYKMDKSGIVRRVESAKQGDAIPTEAVRELWMNDLRKMSDKPKERIESEPPNKYRSIDNSSQGNRPVDMQIKQYVNSLNPEQRTAIYNEFKKKMLTYGTNKLKNILIPKLENTDLTNEQKVAILEKGIIKLHRRLSDSIDEERFFTEVWPRYEMFKNDAQDTPSTPVSFALQPNSTQKQNEYSANRPISFVIRPEYGKVSYPQSETSSVDYSVQRGNDSSVKDAWNDESVHKQYQTKEFTAGEPRGDKHTRKCSEGVQAIYNTFNKLHKHLKQNIKEDKSTSKEEKQIKEDTLDRVLQTMKKNLNISNSFPEEHDSTFPYGRDDGDSIFRDDESVDDIIDRLSFYLKRHIKNDDSINKEQKKVKEEFYHLALNALKNKLKKESVSSEEEYDRRKPQKIEKIKSKEEKSKKSDLSDSDESYEFGLKALKKLLRKTVSEKRMKDELSKYSKDEDRSLKRRRIRDGYTDDQLREIRNDSIHKIPKEERDFSKKAFLEQEKPIDPWKNFYYKLADPPSSNEKEKKILSFDSILNELKSLGRKEFESSNESSVDKNRFAHKCHPKLETEPRSESPDREESKRVVFNMNTIFDKMKELLKTDEELSSKLSNKESNYHNSYNPQPRQLDATTQKMEYDPPKESKQESLDFNSIISKLRENISQKVNKQIDSAPKQVKYSSPYSYQKPHHGTTRINNRNLGMEQNNISFRINPQDYSKSTDRSSGHDEIKFNKSYTNDEDVMPWWFGDAAHSNTIENHYIKEPFIEKQPVTNSLIGNSMFNDSFFDNFVGKHFSKPQLTNF